MAWPHQKWQLPSIIAVPSSIGAALKVLDLAYQLALAVHAKRKWAVWASRFRTWSVSALIAGCKAIRDPAPPLCFTADEMRSDWQPVSQPPSGGNPAAAWLAYASAAGLVPVAQPVWSPPSFGQFAAAIRDTHGKQGLDGCL